MILSARRRRPRADRRAGDCLRRQSAVPNRSAAAAGHIRVSCRRRGHRCDSLRWEFSIEPVADFVLRDRLNDSGGTNESSEARFLSRVQW